MPMLRRAAVALALASALAACNDAGRHDEHEMEKDPSTNPNGTTLPDSTTQQGTSIAPGATATSAGTSTGTATSTPNARP